MSRADTREAGSLPGKKFLGLTLYFVIAVNLIVSVVLEFRPALFLVFGLITDGLNPQIVNVDFSNYWFAGKLMSAGSPVAVLYHEIYFPAAKAFFGDEFLWHSWSYPPHFMLLVWPLSFLPYKLALVTFLGGTLALFVYACRKIIGNKIAREPLFWIMMLPLIFTNIVAVQNGFLTAALMLLAFGYRAEGRYLLAGFCLACLTIKPQVGVLIPIYLVMQRDWRTFAAASGFTAAIVAVTALSFGVDAWTAYLDVTVPYMSHVMNTGTGIFTYMMPTFFMSARVLGLSAESALLVQLVLAIPLLALFVYGISKSEDELARLFLLATCTFLIVPYGFNYDLGAAIALACAVYLERRDRYASAPPSRGRAYSSDIALWILALLPVLTTQLALSGVPVGPLIILAVILYFQFGDRYFASSRPRSQPAGGRP